MCPMIKLETTIELPNFYRYEFVCRCGCGLYNMKPEFLIKLQECRILAEVSFIITSGSRCQKYNRFKNMGGKENSEHLTGEASDIEVVNSFDRYKIIQAALDVGFKRIGIGTNFIHLGISKTLPRGVIWHYY